MDAAAHARMVRARAELVLGHPFFAALALKMSLVEDASCRTAWCDGTALAYNPDRVRTMDPRHLTGVIGHEMLHIACGHHLRRMGRDERLWNIACDHAINWICLDAGLTLPHGYLDDPDLRDLPVEKIYAALLSKKGEEQHGGAESASQGNATDDVDDASQDHGQTGDSDSEGATAGETSKDEESEAPGADAGDSPPAKKAEGNDPAATGEVRDAKDADGAGGEPDARAQEDLRQTLLQAEMAVRDMGDLPLGVQRLLGDILRPKLPWREILARFIEANARNDYSWIPPNRRYLHMGLHLPELRTMELPEIVVALDTSGSITPEELNGFAAELSAILEDFDTTVHLLHCDSAVTRHDVLTRADLPLDIQPRGGGGTDFRPVFELVENEGLSPACLVYLSDMECNRYPVEPHYPVLWTSTRKDAPRPPFGDYISMQVQ